jgi:hypothetical protein
MLATYEVPYMPIVMVIYEPPYMLIIILYMSLHNYQL